VDEGPGMTKAKCVQIVDEEEISLEGKLVWVGGEDGDSGRMKRLKLLEADPMPEAEAEAELEAESCVFYDDPWSICNTACRK